MIILVIFVLSLVGLVCVHLLSQVLVGRLLHLQVTEVVLGFGPKVLSLRFRGVPVCLRGLPLGGYTQLSNANPKQLALAALAGVSTLITLGICLVMVSVMGAREPAYAKDPVVVGWVRAGSNVSQDGLMAGDIVKAVNGRLTATWHDLPPAVRESGNHPLNVCVIRGEGEVTITVRDSLGFKRDIAPHLQPRVQLVQPRSSAALAGIQPGDLVEQAAGQRITHRLELDELIKAGHSDALVIRASSAADREILLSLPSGSMKDVGIIMQDFTTERVKTREAFRRIWELATAVPRSILHRGPARTDSVWDGIKLAYRNSQERSHGSDNGLSVLFSLIPFCQPFGIISVIGILAVVLGLVNSLPLPGTEGAVMLRGLLWGRIPQDKLNAIEGIAFSLFAVLLIVLCIILTVRDCSMMRLGR